MNSGTSRKTAYPLALALLLLSTCTLFLGTSGTSARAAEIPGAITDVQITPTDGSLDDPIRVIVDWCVPDSAKAGDTFTMSLPTQLDVAVSGFPLNDPATGDRVADATITGDVVTFTLTDYAESHIGICGDAWFNSSYDKSQILGGESTDLNFPVAGKVYTVTVTPAAPTPLHVEKVADKWGNWSDEAQTRASWEMVTPSAPAGGWDGAQNPIVFTDDAPAGQEFDCTKVNLTRGHGWTLYGIDPQDVTVQCAPQTLTVRFTGQLPKDDYLDLTVDTTVTNASLNSYTNVAGVQVPGAPLAHPDATVTRDAPHPTATKTGSWVDSKDQTAIDWTINTQDAPKGGWAGQVKITDHAQTGLAFDCSTLTTLIVTPGTGSVTPDADDLNVTCSAGDLDVSYDGGLREGQRLEVEVNTNVTDRSLTEYNNTATIAAGGATSAAGAVAVKRSDAGGSGAGTNAPTPPAGAGTGAAQPATPPAQPSTPASATTATSDTEKPEALPNTGGPSVAALIAGLALVVGGAACVLRTRRRAA